MSSFHPLGPAATGSHPLTGQTGAAALPFHADDEDSWTPPSLPGEASALGSNNKARVKAGGSSSIRSPLDHAPVHPLGGSLSAGDTSTTLGNSSSNYSNGNGHSGGGGGGVGDDDNNLGRRAVGPADSSRVGRGFSGPTPAWGAGVGAGTRGGGASAVGGRQGGGGDRNDQEGGRRRVAAGGGRGAGRSMAAGGDVINGGGAGGGFGGESRTLSDIHTLRLHSYYVPTFCDACSQLLIGIMQQGLRCDVCGMNLHPECRATPCSLDHRCRPPETVHIPSGVDDSRLVGVRLKPGYPSRAMGGAAAAGPRAALGAGGGGGTALPLEDPLDSDWHKQLVHNNQLWVPDAVASDCMVCARPFNLVFRRHHCRRCGTCMCGSCSHTAVSDKILAVNQSTGGVVRLSSGQPVRCCTPCTRILDQQLVQALQRKGWGPKRPNAAAGADPASARSPAAPTHAGAAGGYAASLPASYASTESLDGGGFVPPPSSSSLSASHTFPASGGGGGGGDGIGNGYDGGRRGGDGYGASPASGGDDPLSRGNQQQQPGPPPPPQLPEPPASTGVPSWLGNSSLSTRRATGGGSVASRAPAGGQHPQEVEEEQEEEGVWGAAAVDPEESTDWSVAGAVV